MANKFPKNCIFHWSPVLLAAPLVAIFRRACVCLRVCVASCSFLLFHGVCQGCLLPQSVRQGKTGVTPLFRWQLAGLQAS